MTMLLDRPADVGAVPLPLADTNPPAATIERAENLIVQLCDILPQLSVRDLSNVSIVLERISRMSQGDGQGFVRQLAEDPLDVGTGNRPHDQMEREINLARTVVVTHAAIVAHYADDMDGAKGTPAEHTIGSAIFAETADKYGYEIGLAIQNAAFEVHLHRKYHGAGDPLACDRCFEGAD